MQTVEPSLSPPPGAGAPRGRRRRHRAKRRRQALGFAAAIWVGVSSLMAVAGGGVASYIAHQGGPGPASRALASLLADLFASHDGPGDGTGAMCRIGDAGTFRLAELVPPGSSLVALLTPLMCTIGDDGTVGLAALIPSESPLAARLSAPMCTVGDPGTLTLAALTGGDGDGGRTPPDAPSDRIGPLADADPDIGDLIPLAGGKRPPFGQPPGPTSPSPPAEDPPIVNPPRSGPPFQPFTPFSPFFSPDPNPDPGPTTPLIETPLVAPTDPIIVPEPSTLVILAASCLALLGARHRRMTPDAARKG